jgi:DNA-binding transcriptional MerR regulator
MTKDFYTIDEMAELLRIRAGTVRNRLWRRAQSLPPSMVIGRRRLFPHGAYELWKQEQLDRSR